MRGAQWLEEQVIQRYGDKLNTGVRYEGLGEVGRFIRFVVDSYSRS